MIEKPLTARQAKEMIALLAYADEGDGGHFAFTPRGGWRQLSGRVAEGMCFVVDAKGGGKLYAGGPGSRMISRVKVHRP